MQNEPESYGISLPTIDKIRLLLDWAPLLGLLEAIPRASTNQGKALAGVEVLRWLAKKTSTGTDDAALDKLEAILKTPQGGEICDFIVLLAGAIK